ncbi:helix-turn-helix domain-containing protein [Nocardia sp. NPDC059246]|uniref:helix-turn-helix domain-containing protein n=1 Tax=unclassified Nocardia TaxID=2637762 RepID=UPI00368B2BE1
MATEQIPRRGRNFARSPFLEADWERVGETLRTIRELRGFKPEQLAALMGISRPYLANIEAGRKRLTDINLARAADALAIPQIAIMRPVIAAVPMSSSARSSRQEVPSAAASTTPALEEAGARAL